MIMNVHMVNAKVVVENLIYKFFVDIFLIWSCLESQIFILNLHILIFHFLKILKQSRMKTHPLSKLQSLTRPKTLQLNFSFKIIRGWNIQLYKITKY
jgi:hypothetical protein